MNDDPKVTEYVREKFCMALRVEKEIVKDIENWEHLTSDVEIRMKAYLWAKTIPEKEIVFKPPTFIEWLCRKSRKVRVMARDVLLEPPSNPDMIVRFYEINQAEG